MVETKQASTLIRAMRGSLRGYWAQAEGYQKFLYFVGFLLLASAVFHGVVLVVTGGSLEGDVAQADSLRRNLWFDCDFRSLGHDVSPEVACAGLAPLDCARGCELVRSGLGIFPAVARRAFPFQ